MLYLFGVGEVPISISSTPGKPLRQQRTAGLVIRPTSALFVKLSYEYWMPSDFPAFHSGHVGVGGAF